MIDQRDVTACLVTRGDQPEMMRLILESLIFDNVTVWDNSVQADQKCAGRYWATLEAETPFVYFQDDDVLVPETTQAALVRMYDDHGVLATWGHGDTPDGYEDLPLVCGGAIVDQGLPWRALNRYLAEWPEDDAFRYEADFVAGVLYEKFTHVHLPFAINLEVAQDGSRLCNQPWQRDLKFQITQRARAIRDEVLV